MALETSTYINGLVVTNPVDSTDQVASLGGHVRLLKSAIKATFPNISGAVNPTQQELNYLVGVTSSIQTQLAAKAVAADITAAVSAHAAASNPHTEYATALAAHVAAADPHPLYLLAADSLFTELAETTLSENTWINKAHSLGVVPSYCAVSLRCKTSEHGYAVNDEILFSSAYNTAFATDRRAVVMNSTNVSFFFSDDTVFPDKTTGAPCTLTPASWAIVVRVRV